MWVCRCSLCDRIKIVKGTVLSQGRITGCGCQRGRPKNLAGKPFGRLKAIEPHPVRSNAGRVRWICECSCGNETIVTSQNLITKHTKSCGCIQEKHNYASHEEKHPLYEVWSGMKRRCYNPNKLSYKNYGGRGIIVCDEWRGSANTFINWALVNGWKEGLQIDRRDNDGNYCPENCRFVTPRKNILNQRLLISTNSSGYRGVSRTPDNTWASRININRKRIHLGTFKTKKDALDARNNYIIDNGLQDDYAIQDFREDEEEKQL